MNRSELKTTVLGAGSWGITLANLCSDIGHQTTLWEFDAKEAEKLQIERKREAVLPGIMINNAIRITSDIEQAVRDADMILLVVPSHVSRGVLQQLDKCKMKQDVILISCTKGIEVESHKRISEIFQEEVSRIDFDHFAVLSGPSHAEEVSRKIPTAIVAASTNDRVAQYVQQALNTSRFRVYRSHDVIGVEIGGSLKNVIAIAAGICDGAGFGDNTKAALQPRGLAEIARLGKKLGAEPMTFAGLSGMGDLIATCMSRHSRNRFVGEQIGRGKSLEQVLAEMTMVAEGVRTCNAAHALAEIHKVEMPISREVYNVLFDNKDPIKAMEDLMSREVKPEIWY